MMGEFIPFITGREQCELAAELHADARMIRVSAYQVARLKDCLPKIPLWIDAGVDGLEHMMDPGRFAGESDPRRKPWFDLISSFPSYERIVDLQFQRRPVGSAVERFVNAAMSACRASRASVISVPQLARSEGTSRNKINRAMAEAAAKWQLRHPKISLVLPVILNHGDHSSSKRERNGHVKEAAQCLQLAQAKGIWIVDASLNDEAQSAEKRRERMECLIAFHSELNEALSQQSCRSIAGPYWALNLLLWSRRLVDWCGIGVGTGYQYHLPGGFPSKGTDKIAIEPLRRRARAGPKLHHWFSSVLDSIDTSHPFYRPFSRLQNIALSANQARRQTATFYRGWMDELIGAPLPGRGMAMFQALSRAFSYGKLLRHELPAEEGAARRPESIVEPLMLNCL